MKQNIVEFPDRSTIAEEAGGWLIKMDRDTPLSSEELAALHEWYQRGPLHREELSELAQLWGKMNVLTELAVPFQESPTSSPGNAESRSRRGYSGGLVPIGVTAVVLITGLAMLFAFWLWPEPWDADNGLYATAIGQQQSTILADGSVVLLNTNSQVRVEYSDNFRDIYLLQGEVYCEVAGDETRPFRVYAGNGRVEAIGTAFSVYLKNNTVDVNVTEGKVALASLVNAPVVANGHSTSPTMKGQPTTVNDTETIDLGLLSAGQSTTIRNVAENETGGVGTIGLIETVDQQEMSRRLSWQQGMLTFAGDPLEEVVEEISRYTNLTIEITDSDVRAIKIGGQFPVGETDAMLDALEVNFGLSVTRIGDDHVLLASAKGF